MNQKLQLKSHIMTYGVCISVKQAVENLFWFFFFKKMLFLIHPYSFYCSILYDLRCCGRSKSNTSIHQMLQLVAHVLKKGIEISSDQEIKVSSVLNLSGNTKICSYNLLTTAEKHGKPVFLLGQNLDLAFICQFYICVEEVPKELPISRCVSNT